MHDKDYFIAFKKAIRSIIKNSEADDLSEQIYIIKSILIYISKIILFEIEEDKSEIEITLERFEEVSEIRFKSLIKDIENINTEYIYNEVLDKENKIKLIKITNNIKKEDLIDFSLGELYDYFTTGNEKKYLGQVYTPKDIVEDMINSNISESDIIKNPYIKVIDPACGGGYFLLEAYSKIKKIILKNYDKIIMYDNTIEDKLNCGVHEFILEYNIWGIDIDEFAVYMTRFSLSIKGEIKTINIFKLDVLLSESSILKENFDLVIGNPPYIGHKKIDKNYRVSLSQYYSDVYSDKGDIAYCFFKKAESLLSQYGKLSFITSRYFIESPSGRGLRSFIKQRFSIKSIIDFYGQNVFKGIGISPLIINCTKEQLRLNNIKILKRIRTHKTLNYMENINKNFIEFEIKQDELQDNGWILLSHNEKDLFDKIHLSSQIKLDDLSQFNQGVITGCDKAFIIDDAQLEEYPFEKDLIKPWIKNSDINKFYLKEVKKYIIYSDKIKDQSKYPNAIKWIKKYKKILENRRESKNGIRKWYELQWGREEDLFKGEKIIFPYKASENKFAISRDEVCSSADVYFIKLKENPKVTISLEYLVAFLNSKVCEYYFKCIAKKLNDKLYEYYPNKLINLSIKVSDDMSYVENLVKQIETLQATTEDIKIIELESQINKYIYELYKLNTEEIKLIENYY